MSKPTVDDEEVLYRRIPPGSTWFEPPDRMSSGNFKTRLGETGISVYRKILVDISGVLSRPDAVEGSGVVETTAGEVRAARDGKGDPLNLEVVSVDDENDPGHAEIRGPSGTISKSASNVLRKTFRLVQAPTRAKT